VTKPTIVVEGSRELRRALKQVEGGIADLKEVHAAAATVVAQRAGQLVPRRSGLLASTVRSSGQGAGGVVRSGRASVPYAGPIHFGWPARNISPQPFLFDAIDDRRGEVLEVYEQRVGALVDRHGLA
jgi:hypothetical protein